MSDEVGPNNRDRGVTPAPARFRRAALLASVILASALLLFSGYYSVGAPHGHWGNMIFGTPAWAESDPGGVYLDAAHQLTWNEDPIFVGHPGTPLMLLLSGLQHGYFLLAADPELSFSEFSARRITMIFVASKLMMTVLHLGCIGAVFLLARRVLRSEVAAFFALLGYATSLPVLYYASRISTEPVAVLFFATGLMAAWNYQERIVEGRTLAAYAWVGLSAAAATSAVVSKLNFFAPLPFFLILMLLFSAPSARPDERIEWRKRIEGAVVFALVALVTLAIYSNFINWESYFGLWTKYAKTESPVAWNLSMLMPGFGARRIFPLAEGLYVLIAAGGLIALLRDRSTRRVHLLWISSYGGFGLLLWGIRVNMGGSFLAFHYFFLANVVAALFFGYGVERIVRRVSRGEWSGREVLIGVALTAAVHFISLWAVVDSREHDLIEYAPKRETHELIAKLGSDERIGYTGATRRDFFRRIGRVTAVTWRPANLPYRGMSDLRAGMRSLFVPYDDGMGVASDRWIESRLLGVKLVILKKAEWSASMDGAGVLLPEAAGRSVADDAGVND